MTGSDEEVERLRAAVNCATVLEKLVPGWTLDQAGSTKRALKYRRGPGEIVIVNHGGRGWWDPHGEAKGDVFALAQHLDRNLNFGQVRVALRGLAGIAPSHPSFMPARKNAERVVLAPLVRWQGRRRLHRGSATWRYLAERRRLPGYILALAADNDTIREGPHGSAWFAHRSNDGELTGIEMRGPDYRGFTANGKKTLFRLPGSSRGTITRLVVAEAPINAMSFAALERVHSDTLYTSTAGGMGPDTLTSLAGLLSTLAQCPNPRLVIATDADVAGDRYAARLAQLAQDAGVPAERRLPTDGANDWNDVLKAQAGRAAS